MKKIATSAELLECFKTPKEEFLKKCTLERYQGKGSGGQKRNRKLSGVRLFYAEYQAENCEHRESQRNIDEALNTLLLKLALEGPLPAEFNSLDTPFPISTNNPKYPLWLYWQRFLLKEHSSHSKEVAAFMGISHSQWQKQAYKDKKFWEFYQKERTKKGLHRMQSPK